MGLQPSLIFHKAQFAPSGPWHKLTRSQEVFGFDFCRTILYRYGTTLCLRERQDAINYMMMNILLGNYEHACHIPDANLGVDLLQSLGNFDIHIINHSIHVIGTSYLRV